MNIATGEWTTQPTPIASAGGVAAIGAADDAIFVEKVPGTAANIVMTFNVHTRKWTRVSLSQSRSVFALTVLGNKVFFAGGSRSGPGGALDSDVVDIYDVVTNQWSRATLSQARTSIAAVTVGTFAIFAGGNDFSGRPKTAVDIYNGETRQWSTATLPHAKSTIAATTVDSKVFLAPSEFANDTTIDIFTPATGQWSTGALLQTAYNVTATSVGDFAIFGDSYHNLVTVYDAATDQWSGINLPEPAGSISTTLGSTAFIGDLEHIIHKFTVLPLVQGTAARGGRGSLRVTLINTGRVAMTSDRFVNVYAASHTNGRGAVLLGQTALGQVLAPGDSAVLHIPLSLASLLPGNYTRLLISISPPAMGHGTIFATQAASISVPTPVDLISQTSFRKQSKRSEQLLAENNLAEQHLFEKQGHWQ